MTLKSIKTDSYLLLFFMTSLLIISCGDDNNSKGQRANGAKTWSGGKRPIKAIPVEISHPRIGLAASFYVTTATIEPSSDAKINSRTAGVVKKILHEEGDDVKAGEVLLILDDIDQQLRLQQAKQKLASATREFDRLSKMKKAGVVSPTEWEKTDNAYITAQTDQQLAELALSYTRVAAPFDGRVVWREVDLGAHVGQGELLFRMMSINPLLVRLYIPANRLGMVKKGQAAQLKIDNFPQPLSATVELISPIVDPTTGTIKVTLRLEDYPENVRPGDFTEIQIVTDQHQDALLINSVAIIEERGQHFIYIVENGKAKRQPVTTGFVMSELTEIVSGIEQQNEIVIKGQRNLKDEAPIEILSEDNRPAMVKAELKIKEKGKARGNKKRGQQ